jgi:hypothetical protein
MSEGRFTIPTRIYLTQAQRAKLQHLLDRADRELDDWLTELVAGQVDGLPEPPPEQASAVGDQIAEELRKRRAELRRLRPRLSDPHNPPPPWLVQMVADLEAEVRRLEAATGGGR